MPVVARKKCECGWNKNHNCFSHLDWEVHVQDLFCFSLLFSVAETVKSPH